MFYKSGYHLHHLLDTDPWYQTVVFIAKDVYYFYAFMITSQGCRQAFLITEAITKALKARAFKRVWGHAPQENFKT